MCKCPENETIAVNACSDQKKEELCFKIYIFFLISSITQRKNDHEEKNQTQTSKKNDENQLQSSIYEAKPFLEFYYSFFFLSFFLQNKEN